MEGNIPVLYCKGRSLAEAWERSLVELWQKGMRIRTEYDKPDEPASIDATMIVEIEEPLSEPRIHRCFPAGLDFLEEYRLEVVEGIKDHWVRDKNNPEDTRWEYTYHERMFSYSYFNEQGQEQKINQIDYIVNKLSKAPYTRRAQAITWKVWEDIHFDDPACMQSLWFRLVPVETEDSWVLNMNLRFRSNDAYEASFLNMFAFISLEEKIAGRLAERLGKPVKPGRYVHLADSYHIYGSRIEDFKQRFLSQLEKRSFEERTWTMEFARPFFEEARPLIEQKIAAETKKMQR